MVRGTGQAAAPVLPYNLRSPKPLLLALAAVLLLLNPLDCFSQLADQQLHSCCASRHCNPTQQTRACCKVKLFENPQVFQGAKKCSVPAPDLAAVPVEPVHAANLTPDVSAVLLDFDIHSPPGDRSAIHRPLLI